MKKAEKSIVYHAKDLMCILHINHNEAYALMRRKSFPSMQLGSTLIVKKKLFDAWRDSDDGRSYIESLTHNQKKDDQIMDNQKQ